jgi:hypothetical protein
MLLCVCWGRGFHLCLSLIQCFAEWVSGSQRDNRGFIAALCYCGVEIAPVEVKRLMGCEELYFKYDEAMMRQCLLRAGDAVFCPGADCTNAVIRPAFVKGVSACRSTSCSECATEFCVMCGERFAQGDLSHERVDCKRFKRMLDEKSGVTQWCQEAKKGTLKPCPGCKRPTEKNGGCSSHSCTLCGISFCWKCCSGVCKCHVRRQKKQRRYAKWAERKKLRAGGAGAVAGSSGANDNNAQAAVGNNSNNNTVAVMVSSGGKVRQLVVDRASVSNAFVVERGSRLEHQDLDIVVLAKSEMKALRIAEMMDSEQPLKSKRRTKKKKEQQQQQQPDLAQLSKKDRLKAKKASKWIRV